MLVGIVVTACFVTTGCGGGGSAAMPLSAGASLPIASAPPTAKAAPPATTAPPANGATPTPSATPAPAGSSDPAGWPSWPNAWSHRPLGASPKLASWDGAARAYYQGRGLWTWEYNEVSFPPADAQWSESQDWGTPFYPASTSDPSVTVQCDLYGGCSSLAGTTIHVPANAVPENGYSYCQSGSGDCHMVTFSPDGRFEYDMYQAQNLLSTGHVGNGAAFDTSGDGLTNLGGGSGTAIAGHFALGPTVVTPYDFLSGSVNHGLYVIANCTGGGAVYPVPYASSNNCGANLGNGAPYGARIYLAMSDAQISALGMAPTTTMLLKALAHYGGIIGDTGGNPAFTVGLASSHYPASITSGWQAVVQKYGLPSLGGGRYNLTPGFESLPPGVMNAFHFVDPSCTQPSGC